MGLGVDVWPTHSGPLHFPRLDALSAPDGVAGVLSAIAPGAAVIVSDVGVRDGLLTRGAVQVRHVHTMRHDLREIPAQPPRAGTTLRPWQPGDETLLAPALLAAYGPDHPDPHEPDLAEAAATLVGTAADVANPLIAAAAQVALVHGTPVGAALVVRSDHVPGWSGPWVMNMFRAPDPAYPGIGAVLLARALEVLQAAGEPHLGLAVTSANPARRLYERLGFAYDFEGWVVVLPTSA
ncbi:MAG TPA: GNAT family N-acetyltransferase [Mycobacteriales bacterium]|nr:GNAT family N-acetyltransferase [Mycobacteriales bacterium]